MPRPTVFTPELGALVCEKLAECGSLRRVCRDDPSMPTDNRVRQWVVDFPWFGEAYARAKQAGIDSLVEEGMDIVDEAPPSTESGATDSGHVAWAKTRAEYRRWLAERMAPRRYGALQKLEHSGPDGGAIKTLVVATGVPDGTIDINDLV